MPFFGRYSGCDDLIGFHVASGSLRRRRSPAAGEENSTCLVVFPLLA
jgi:hypothetical protein